MGLDAVEILMEVEETFGVSLDDSEAEKMLTPRDLVDSVMLKVGCASPTVCLTHRTFHQLRASLMRQLNLSRKMVVPGARFGALVPKHRRREVLAQLAEDLESTKTPVLERPTWVVAMLTGVSILFGIALLWVLVSRSIVQALGLALFLAATAACILGFIGAVATLGIRTELPKPLATIGTLTRWFMGHSPPPAEVSPGKWTREQIAERIRQIVVSQLGCGSRYREDARFIEDLGLS